MLIIHIGLPKTGTTSLQRHTFSKLTNDGFIDAYNPPAIMRSLEAFRRGDRQPISELRSYFFNAQRTMISLESLVGMNPGSWRERLDLNREIFPPTTRILITVREPAEYLRSVYQQNIAQGNVISEKEYFLTREFYDAVEPMCRHRLGEIFSVDDFSYRTLLNGYAESFERVVAVPISQVGNLNFLSELGFNLSPIQLRDLGKRHDKGPIENRSFSVRAMKMTFWREQWLNTLGLQSRWAVTAQNNFFADAQKIAARPSAMQRIASAVLPRWRAIMVRGIDRCLPYEKFELATNTPQGRHASDNRSVYGLIEDEGVNSLTLHRGNTLPL